MTLEEAIATQPQWLTWWLNWLLVGTLALPLVLVIWRPTRLAGILTVLATGLSGFGVVAMYERLGYVKLIGLPHIILWTPLVIWLIVVLRGRDMSVWPRRILSVVILTILISLAFDYADVFRYFLGERAPLIDAA
ncbi:MAG: hypothetical protein GKR99_08300 [Rhodobacteraceae bacterium]|nr:hypothetical protein [Paracoccaceae bacterium]